MQQMLFQILSDLCTTPGPAGFEKEIAQKAKTYLAAYCDEITVDPLGNVIGKIRGVDASLPPAMAYAHMDRIGFIVSFLQEDGFLRLQAIGGIPDKVLPGTVLHVSTEDGADWKPGVVGTKCEHLSTEEERSRVQPLSELLIDVGAHSAEQARAMGFEVGCPAVYQPKFVPLGETGVAATALDNCGCVTALIGIAKQLQKQRPPRDTYLAATVWEEYNQRAAAVAVRHINPVAAISMDMLLAGDTPDVRGAFEGTLGQGPVASHYNYSDQPMNGTIAHPGLYQLALRTAKEQDTGLQRYVCYSSLGDNAYAQLQGDGPACIEIGAPVRYAHSCTEVADIRDITGLSVLVAHMLLSLDSTFVQSRYTLD